ncbi:COX15/CtaA family protein [Psychromicrobium xiongbiense]|uniref:COX15/CtaA family protein n=1 Tax=Psychromicrobium xiongbiense TaxID=3051184 RepID=UPI002553B929|nr:COX15/CtaA family protein [Psychromicrobium sp. YIM S02556]
MSSTEKSGFAGRFRSLVTELAAKLPTSITPTIRRLAVASLIGQSVLIGTGGAVRLTASGLGCPTWPKCTAGSLVNTPEMGIHGIIEFGNRTLTFVLAVVAALMLVCLWNLRKERKDMFWLAFGLLASIPAQAVIGGITVLSNLNPWVVGLHFLVSAALVVFSMLLVNRAYDRPFAGQPAVRPLLKQLSLVAAILVGLAVMLGVSVTGAGPHAGDAQAPRNGLDPDLITRIHVLPVYLLVAVTVLLVALCWRRGRADQLRAATLWLLAAVVVQAVIGYTQHFTGLPPLLVGMHMVGAAALLAAGTNIADVALRGRR